jgi:hypothetical protein
MDEQAMRFFTHNFVTGARNDIAERRIFHLVGDGGMAWVTGFCPRPM